MCRGGTPSAFDRILVSEAGAGQACPKARKASGIAKGPGCYEDWVSMVEPSVKDVSAYSARWLFPEVPGGLLTNGAPWPSATLQETPPNMGTTPRRWKGSVHVPGSRNGPRDHRDPECSLHFLLCTPLSPQPQWLVLTELSPFWSGLK